MIKKEKLNITWECSTRADLFDKELAVTMKDSGCVQVYLGLESGTQQTLNFLNKGLTIERTIDAVSIAKNAGLRVESNFMIGIPGETKDSINKTISFVKKMNIDYPSFTILTPYPGTPLYSYAEKNNLLLSKEWSLYTANEPVMSVPGISYRELKGLYLKAFLICSFNLPKIVKSLVRELRLKKYYN